MEGQVSAMRRKIIASELETVLPKRMAKGILGQKYRASKKTARKSKARGR